MKLNIPYPLYNYNHNNIRAIDAVVPLSNEVLRDLLKEVAKISRKSAPLKHKKSLQMKYLFECERVSYSMWYDQFSNVRTAIELEVLRRVREGVL